MSVVFRLFSLGLMAALAGCDDAQSTAQLHAYLQAAPQSTPAFIAPVPSVEPARAVAYEASALRSPFQVVREGGSGSWQVSLLVADELDIDRSRQFLEGLDLEQFEMVGTFSNDQGASALLRADGIVHRLKVGDYLGRNNGQVAFIDPAHVEVFEVISDGQGGWLERSLSIPLKQQS
ncbi:pilus assembly protein PilP [Pseudomonas sp. CCC3.1]|uniref:pilus assembly protein PilP n=1 Tax=Pseudomonas sp. CCC3.1 TaxID=3048607 RepID=UPI002AC9DCDB|nr:pilus assembly protein PilP [Pseudomonas sp. CCC3.1]MEB0205270.1 pilus assembly protein PilP [Pseudomonas sp. CCC3.1]WPX35782.1 pilus assembly protein PilP [Pseudomonas sp. CCC3.1]